MKKYTLNDKIQFSFSFSRHNIVEVTADLCAFLLMKIKNRNILKETKTLFYNSSISTYDCKSFYRNSKITIIFPRRKFFSLVSAKIKIYLDSNNLVIFENRSENYYGKEFYDIKSLSKAEIEKLCCLVKEFIKSYETKGSN